MPAWLWGLIAGIPGWLRGPFTLIVGGIVRVFQWFDILLRRFAPGWGHIIRGAWWVGDGIWHLGHEVWLTAWWTLSVAIPGARDWALHAAINWAAARLNEVRGWVWGLVSDLWRWSIDRVRELLSTVDGLRRWVIDRLVEAFEAVNRLILRVFDDWASPTRLAAWLVAAMWSALWGYAWSNLDRYADWLWTRRRAILLRGAIEIERLLARLL